MLTSDKIQKLQAYTNLIERLRDHMSLIEMNIAEQLEKAKAEGLDPAALESVIFRREGGVEGRHITCPIEASYHLALGDKIEKNEVAA